jgi:hypothetical protein
MQSRNRAREVSKCFSGDYPVHVHVVVKHLGVHTLPKSLSRNLNKLGYSPIRNSRGDEVNIIYFVHEEK